MRSVENFFNRKKDQALVNNLNVKEDARECTGVSSSSSRLGLDVAVGNAVKGDNFGNPLSPGVKGDFCECLLQDYYL